MQALQSNKKNEKKSKTTRHDPTTKMNIQPFFFCSLSEPLTGEEMCRVAHVERKGLVTHTDNVEASLNS